MLLQTVRPNIVQSIRAYRVEDLLEAAQAVNQHFLYANLTAAQSKQDVLDGIAALETDAAAQRDWYVRHLQREPSLVAAAKWIAGEKLEHEQFHPQVQRALDHAVKPLTRYRCAACGFEARQHFWHCPGCQSWDSYPPRRVEEL